MTGFFQFCKTKCYKIKIDGFILQNNFQNGKNQNKTNRKYIFYFIKIDG